MSKIFGGFLLIFLEYNITKGNIVLGLLPDFVGYICIVAGLCDVVTDGAYFRKARLLAIILSFYSAVVYVLNLLGIAGKWQILSWALSIITTLATLGISYLIVKGLPEAEQKYNAKLSSKSIRICWMIMAVFQVVMILALWVPVLVLLMVPNFLATIVFLVMFFQACKVYGTIPGK